MDTEIIKVNGTDKPAAVLTEADGLKRFLNLIIDIGIIISLIIIFNKFYFFLRILHIHVAFKLFDLALVFSYFYGLESSIGQTVGKMLTKTKVISDNGDKPTSQQMLVRTIARFIPFEPVLFIGGNWLHDSLSHTKVVCIKN
ncbi:MAG: RDD family protein [Ignavibacteria bacterium]|nr:RDD family protein [Ignavibacteria bacterium]